MHLGTVLTISTVGLLILEVLTLFGIVRLTLRVDGHPGGHILRIITRTLLLIVLAQGLEVLADVHLDSLIESPENAQLIVLELGVLVLEATAFLWVWWDLTHDNLGR